MRTATYPPHVAEAIATALRAEREQAEAWIVDELVAEVEAKGFAYRGGDVNIAVTRNEDGTVFVGINSTALAFGGQVIRQTGYASLARRIAGALVDLRGRYGDAIAALDERK